MAAPSVMPRNLSTNFFQGEILNGSILGPSKAAVAKSSVLAVASDLSANGSTADYQSSLCILFSPAMLHPFELQWLYGSDRQFIIFLFLTKFMLLLINNYFEPQTYYSLEWPNVYL